MTEAAKKRNTGNFRVVHDFQPGDDTQRIGNSIKRVLKGIRPVVKMLVIKGLRGWCGSDGEDAIQAVTSVMTGSPIHSNLESSSNSSRDDQDRNCLKY